MIMFRYSPLILPFLPLTEIPSFRIPRFIYMKQTSPACSHFSFLWEAWEQKFCVYMCICMYMHVIKFLVNSISYFLYALLKLAFLIYFIFDHLCNFSKDMTCDIYLWNPIHMCIICKPWPYWKGFWILNASPKKHKGLQFARIWEFLLGALQIFQILVRV